MWTLEISCNRMSSLFESNNNNNLNKITIRAVHINRRSVVMSNKDKEKGEIEKRTKAYISSTANQLTNAAPETELLQSNFRKQRHKNRTAMQAYHQRYSFSNEIKKKESETGTLGFWLKHTSENVFFTGIKQIKPQDKENRKWREVLRLEKNVCVNLISELCRSYAALSNIAAELKISSRQS